MKIKSEVSVLPSSPSKEDENNVDNLCRLCLLKDDDAASVTVNIFDNLNENVSLPLRIMACASLEVQQSDALPKRLCLECRYQLEKSYVFRKKCKISDTKLRRHFRLINAGKKSRLFDEDQDNDDEDEEEFADSNVSTSNCIGRDQFIIFSRFL